MKKHSIKATAKLKKKDWRQRAKEINARAKERGRFWDKSKEPAGTMQVVFFKKPRRSHSPKENKDGNGTDLLENNPSTKL
ncbi:MAG: hypothetical protein HZA34_04800 [Candidatus Pacebacteria bacterium]|nr:hypothetical protein [Candidatus Paceibacterota bacterium]